MNKRKRKEKVTEIEKKRVSGYKYRFECRAEMLEEKDGTE